MKRLTDEEIAGLQDTANRAWVYWRDIPIMQCALTALIAEVKALRFLELVCRDSPTGTDYDFVLRDIRDALAEIDKEDADAHE
jgi:hypothetical protein